MYIYAGNQIYPDHKDVFKTAVKTSLIQSRLAEQNRTRDMMYIPPLDCTIGSHVPKAILVYPGTLVDHIAYSAIMSKLSDKGILIVVSSPEPL